VWSKIITDETDAYTQRQAWMGLMGKMDGAEARFFKAERHKMESTGVTMWDPFWGNKQLLAEVEVVRTSSDSSCPRFRLAQVPVTWL
jgi:hypothetical protein